MKVETAELEGAALDWAVAQIDPMCAGLVWEWNDEFGCMVGIGTVERDVAVCAFLSFGLPVTRKIRLRRRDAQSYSPSTDWSQGGPLVERYDVTFYGSSFVRDGEWAGRNLIACVGYSKTKSGKPERATAYQEKGEGHLVAAMRAIVAAELGQEVEIPGELIPIPE